MKYALIALILCNAAHAEPNYQEGLELCKVALNSCKDENIAQNDLQQQKTEALKFYKEENQSLRSSRDSIFNNVWLYLTLGLVAGAYIRGK